MGKDSGIYCKSLKVIRITELSTEKFKDFNSFPLKLTVLNGKENKTIYIKETPSGGIWANAEKPR